MAFLITPRGDVVRTRRRVTEIMIPALEPGEHEWLTETWLRPGQVAALFQVSRRAVSDWALSGRIPSMRTPGGHHRFLASDVRDLLAKLTVAEPSSRYQNKSE